MEGILTVIPVSHHDRALRDMSCIVSQMRPVTLHHCHSGSMMELGPEFPNPGWAQRNNPFLQIPLHAKYHVGDFGVDVIGVETWEDHFGSQVEHLEEINGMLNYDLWRQATLWAQSNRGSTWDHPKTIQR